MDFIKKVLEFPLIIGNEGEIHCDYDQKRCKESYFLEGSNAQITTSDFLNKIIEHIDTCHSDWWSK